jgi:hypothetical protein
MLAPASARAQDHGPYFYHGRDYGSESLYSPAYVLLNRGFDVLQLRPGRRSMFDQHWALNAQNVWNNVKSPLTSISGEGWGRFVSQELLPLSFTPTTARWAPNYSLHLIGGGMTYRELREWFEAHDAPPAAATAMSVFVLFTAAFVNESLENNGVVGRNTDCLADLYLFDVGGVLLFSVPEVSHFFSHEVLLSDWSLQPAFTLPSGQLHNTGNYYALKWPLPFYPRLRLFAYGGFASLAGLSFKLDGEYSLSAAAGGKVDYFENSATTAVENTVQMKASGALFLDRNDSLLVSVQASDVRDYFIHVNVYPNAVFHTDPGIGVWTVLSKDGHYLAGISFTRSLGFGVGTGSFGAQ